MLRVEEDGKLEGGGRNIGGVYIWWKRNVGSVKFGGKKSW